MPQDRAKVSKATLPRTGRAYGADTCLVLIPTYNERENIDLLLPAIFSLLPDINVMVIDDASPDGTGERVTALSRRYPNLRLHSRKTKEGLGKAYADAFGKVLKETDFRSVITMDADGSHDARYLPALLSGLAVADVVVGSRYTSGGGVASWEKWRRLLSRGGNLYARLLTGLPIKDLTAGFICMDKETLARITLSDSEASGYAFLIDLKFRLVHQGGARIAEVPIVFGGRRHGESKISGQIIAEGLRVPLRLLARRLATPRRR